MNLNIKLDRRQFMKLLGAASAVVALPALPAVAEEVTPGNLAASGAGEVDDGGAIFEINGCPVSFFNMDIEISYPVDSLRAFDGTVHYVPVIPNIKLKFNTEGFDEVCRARFRSQGLKIPTWRLQYDRQVISGFFSDIQSYQENQYTFGHEMFGTGIERVELATV